MDNGFGMYRCHRNGDAAVHTRQLKRRPKTSGSRKTTRSCPCYIKKTVNDDNTILVVFCLVHIDHGLEVKHISLTHRQKLFLAARLLAANQNTNEVMKIIADMWQKIVLKNPQAKPNLLHVTSIKDLENIRISFNLRGRIHQNELIALAGLIESINQELTKESISSPFIEYRPFHVDVNEKAHFFLIIMNQEMRQLLLENGDNIVCIDATHGTNHQGLQLSTLMVVTHDSW